MELFKNRELFENIINEITDETGIEPSIIEKDYYVSIVLRELTKKLPNMVFKGGTSLSKCYDVIKRFSEDIDITLEQDNPTQGERSAIKTAMLEILSEFNFELLNPEEIRSRMEYNKYKVDYPAIFTIDGLKRYIYVESVLSVKAFPLIKKDCKSIIYNFLKERGLDNVIAEYNLQPFEVKTQTIERTFIDKVFALCDYYIDGRITEHSRHIYDLYKLLPLVDLNEKLKPMIAEIRECRKNNKFCYSAADGVNINEILTKIVSEGTYKADYNSITSVLLYENVSYEQAITVIDKILKANLF